LGWSLSMIDFETTEIINNHKLKDATGDLVVGTYVLSLMPMPEHYFLEIVVVYCEGHGEDFFRVHLWTKCVEDNEYGNFIITKGNGTASIEIVIDRHHASNNNNINMSQQKQVHEQRQMVAQRLWKVLLRSAHSNGFKRDTLTCPPRDLRSPPNADMATRIIREIDSVFHSSRAWSCYRGEAESVEARFILSEILKDTSS